MFLRDVISVRISPAIGHSILWLPMAAIGSATEVRRSERSLRIPFRWIPAFGHEKTIVVATSRTFEQPLCFRKPPDQIARWRVTSLLRAAEFEEIATTHWPVLLLLDEAIQWRHHPDIGICAPMTPSRCRRVRTQGKRANRAARMKYTALAVMPVAPPKLRAAD